MRQNGGVNVLRNRAELSAARPDHFTYGQTTLCPLTGGHIGPKINAGQFGEKILVLLSGVEPGFFHRPSISLVPLPSTLAISCTSCDNWFWVPLRDGSTVHEINQPFCIRGTALLHSQWSHIWDIVIEIHTRKVLKDLGFIAWFLYFIYRLIRLYISY